ncbi:hypothetical protein [Staphylococcus epidermidis]|uniref:hypothetical protein n=1 Tax=Staphylococcus epidermidis TaxID=1282 RepID=UPI00246862E4|nr:hypothetical protein [Staphylococcus epidermidis]
MIDDELLNRISNDILQLVNSTKDNKRQSMQEEIKLEKEKRDGKARKQRIKERLKQERQQKQMQLV